MIINEILKEFPKLSYYECEKIFDLCIELDLNKEIDSVDLAITAPHSFGFESNPTAIVMRELLESSQKSIIITGYSISEYFEDLIDILISKIRIGVFVKLYLNDFDSKREVLSKLLLFKGRFLEIYNFNKSEKGIEVLHAKVISVDSQKSLITSANLSFNGLQKNIEVGSVIHSKRIAKNLEETFLKLYNMKVFSKI